MEFALILPLVLLLLVGIIEFGISYNSTISMRSGVREGARLAVVDDVKNAPSCEINGVTITSSASPPDSSAAAQALVCKTKARIGLDQSRVKVRVTVPAAAKIGDEISVCASYPLKSITGLLGPFIDGKTLKSTVTMRLETLPSFVSYTEPGGTCP